MAHHAMSARVVMQDLHDLLGAGYSDSMIYYIESSQGWFRVSLFTDGGVYKLSGGALLQGSQPVVTVATALVANAHAQKWIQRSRG